MKWLKRFFELLQYGPLFAALLPTLLVLLAAGVILADGRSAAPLTMPTVPIYRTS